MTDETRRKLQEVAARTPRNANGKYRKDEPNQTTEATPSKDEPSPRDPVPVDVYFEAAREKFWALNEQGEWQPIGKGLLELILRSKWYSTYDKLTNSLTRVESKVLDVVQYHSVHYAGELAGWKPGIHFICGHRVLITRGPRLAEPKKGAWPLIKKFLRELLGEEARWFYAWMRAGFQSLSEGAPFAPGQALAVAGPAGCGKSLLQMLITEILGGRMAKPYRYLTGGTDFNGELIGAEHLVLDDEVGKSDGKSRRDFGSKLKALVANKQFSAHPKGRSAFVTEPFWRVSISLNDEAEALMVLPPLDADIADKLILLKARPATFPYPSKEFPTMGQFWAALKAEIPAYLHALFRADIPEEMRDPRYGVKAYHDPDLLFALSSLSPEMKLWALIEQSGLLNNVMRGWTGTQVELERQLQESCVARQFGDLCYFPTAAGVYLSRLAKSLPKNVMKEAGKDHKNIYHFATE